MRSWGITKSFHPIMNNWVSIRNLCCLAVIAPLMQGEK
jgi:hypothetical protein